MINFCKCILKQHNLVINQAEWKIWIHYVQINWEKHKNTKTSYLNEIRMQLTIINFHMVCNQSNSLHSSFTTMLSLISKKWLDCSITKCPENKKQRIKYEKYSGFLKLKKFTVNHTLYLRCIHKVTLRTNYCWVIKEIGDYYVIDIWVMNRGQYRIINKDW